MGPQTAPASSAEVCQRRLHPPVPLGRTVASSVAWPGALPPCARARTKPRATRGPRAVRPSSGPGRSSAPAPRSTCALVNRSEPQTPRRHPGLSPGSASPTKMSTASRPTLRPAGSLLTRIVRTQRSFTKELALPAPDSKCGSLHKTRVVQPPWLSHCAGAVGGQGHGMQARPWRAGARRGRGPAATLPAHGGRGPGSAQSPPRRGGRTGGDQSCPVSRPGARRAGGWELASTGTTQEGALVQTCP